MTSRTTSTSQRQAGRPVLSLVISLIIILIGIVQLLSTAYTYVVNVSELNTLRNQEASLLAQKADLENNIARWDDKAYIVSQARERLGFVFPGETSVMVLGANTIKEDSANTAPKDSKGTDSAQKDSSNLPWYKELQYSFQQADSEKNAAADRFQDGTSR